MGESQLQEIISIERLQQGNEEELKLFFKHYFPMFVSFANQYVNDRQVCEDIVQEAFIAFWKSRASFKNIYYIRAYLYKLIRNECLNHIRHQRVQLTHLQYDKKQRKEVESNSYFLDSIIQEESARLIAESLNNLSPTGREIILLAMEGLSNQEIAEKLNISVNTVRTHKARSYQYLRARLADLRILFLLL